MVTRDPAGGRSLDRRSHATSTTDPRFEGILKSSLYRRPSNKKTKVTLDKRFASMLTDERFSSKAKVDRYGRKLRATTNQKDGKTNVELAKLYRVEDEEKDTSASEDEVQAELSRVAKKYGDIGYDPARDGGFSESSSEEESELDVAEEQIAETEIVEVNADAVPEGEVSRRLAVVNLDWDHVRAVDLLAVFNSYASTGSSNDKVEKVTIYPSEFGKERMEREEMEGPPKELFANKKSLHRLDEDDTSSSDEEVDDVEDTDEDEDERIRKSLVKEDTGEEVSSTKLRSYQLERLRYFYAVVACSSPSVAKQIYDNVDGREYLSSANFFDLRFIPDGMDFQDDKPRDECSKIPTGYRPNEFVTAALQHSKVKLTWDAEDAKRKEIQQRAFSGSRKDLDENELRAYLASDNSSSEDEQDVDIVDSTIGTTSELVKNSEPPTGLSKSEIKRQAMRAKLGLSDESNTNQAQKNPPLAGGMQVTFTPGLSAAEKQASVFENGPESGMEETTAERYIRKERERKARRKEKHKAQRAGTAPAGATTKEAESTVTNEQQEDDSSIQGFNDPFFTATPAEAEAQAAEQKKKAVQQKKRQRQQRRAAEAQDALPTTNETNNLERIIQLSSNTENATGHFSLSALEKAEKALRKQKIKKRARLSQSEKAALEAKARDEFEMDVADERFAAVFERPEFALDPAHPRFRGTEGMQSLLSEARERRMKKRKVEEGSDDDDRGVPAGKTGRRY